MAVAHIIVHKTYVVNAEDLPEGAAGWDEQDLIEWAEETIAPTVDVSYEERQTTAGRGEGADVGPS